MRHSRILLIVLALGLTIRFLGALARPRDLTADNDGYLAHARLIAAGAGFAGPYTHKPTAFRPPAYPIFLAALLTTDLPVPVCVAIINELSTILIVGCTWGLCRLMKLQTPTVVLAVVITTFDPLLIRYSILPMTEVPTAAILMSALVVLKASNSISRRLDSSQNRLAFVSGLLFGLGSLVRPVVLLSCALVAFKRILLVLRLRENYVLGVSQAVLPMIAACVALSPWIIRNAVQFHRLIPATTHGGYTLALGNNADFYREVINGKLGFPWPGPQLDAWQKKMIAEAEAQGVPAGDEPATDAWYYQQAVASISAEPVSFLKACLLRLSRFCAVTPGASEGFPLAIRTGIAIWYLGVFAGMGAALLKLGRSMFGKLGLKSEQDLEEHSGLADLWLVVLSFMLLHSVYWTDTRMRAPVMPVLCVIAAVGWQSLIGSKDRTRKLNA